MRSSRLGLAAIVMFSVIPFADAEEPDIRMDEIQDAIRESEYYVSWQDQTVLPDLDAAWHAANRAQNLRFYFTDDGLRVVDRTAEGRPELVRLRVALPSRQANGRSSILEHSENTVVVRRDGLTERFVNSEWGLEHVMIIGNSRPRVEPVRIELDFVVAGLDVNAVAVELRTATGRRLTYSVEEALDASGEPVSVEFGLVDGRLVITVAEYDAALPVTVKNLLTGAANTVLQGNTVDLLFGSDVSVGDVNGDGFADVVVGAQSWDGGQIDEGAVLVFHGGPGGIASNGAGALVPNAVIESNLAGFHFPTSLAVIGDVDGDGFDDIAAGETRWDPVNPPASTQLWGAVWIFEGSALGITASNLSHSDSSLYSGVQGAALGVSVAGAGDCNGDGFSDMVVGAWLWSDDPAQPSEGMAWVVLGSETGISQDGGLIEGNQAQAYAGLNVAGVGDVNGDGFDDIAVGAPFLDHGEPDEGAVVIFHGNDGGIDSNPTEALADAADSLIEGNLDFNTFSSFSGAGDINGDGYGDLVVGSGLWGDSPSHPGEGVALVYHGGPMGIPSNGSASAADVADTVIEGNPSPHGGIELGDQVAGVGDVNGDGFSDLVLGANRFANGDVDEGALFVFHGRQGGIPNSRTNPVEEVADNVIEGNSAGLFLGGTRPAAGDVNGDGYSDLVAPVPHYAASEHAEGAVLIYHGGGDVPRSDPDARYDEPIANSHLGYPAAGVGDLNGDGYADFAAGAPLDGGWMGKVHVFYGSPGAVLTTPDWSYVGSFVGGRTGQSVASAGDVNGDGFGDLAIGTPELSNPEIQEGRVEVFYGSASGLSSSPSWFFEADVDHADLGWHVASAGDVDGDGYGDLIVGAPEYSEGQSYEGRAYLFFGSASGLSASPGWTYQSDVASAFFGLTVTSAGDVNADGYGDVVVGAPFYELGQINEGAAYGFYGGPNGLPDTPNWFIQTNRDEAWYGFALAGIGDVNGDGFSDVAVGAPYDTNDQTREGRVFVYNGSAGGLSTVADRVLEQNTTTAEFGSCVSGVGDINGDGYADLVVGSPNSANAPPIRRAYLFLGSAAGIAADPAWFVERPVSVDGFGSAVANIGDFDGDGFSDMVVSAPASGAGAAEGGSVELYLGNAGAGRPVLARQSRGVGDPTPVQPWGLSHSGDSFQVSMTATSPRGRELVKLHVEACPPGEVWGDVDCRHQVSADWTAIPLGENGVVLTEAVSGLTEDVLYHWRAHVLFIPLHADEPGIAEPPVPRHGPWRTLSARADIGNVRVGEPQIITIEFVGVASPVGEGVPQAQIDLVMTTSDGEASAVDSSVDFGTFDVTAVAGEDYVHTSFNRFFPVGTASGTAQAIEVDLINDDLDEPEEDFVIELYNSMGAVLGAQNTHTVTIADDDPPPELSALNVEVDEGAGSAMITLGLSAPTSFDVTVDFATVDGSATAPMDYVSVNGTMMIPPMNIVTTVEIPIEDDWLEEASEFFTLELTNPVNVDLATSEVTVTIIDDDAGFLFADGFESGDTGRWTGVTP